MNKKIEVPIYVIILVVIVIILIPLIGLLFNYINDKKFDNDYMKRYEEIEYSIPNEFKKIDSDYYSYYSEDMSCSFSIIASKKYEEDFEKWFKGTVFSDLNDEVSSLEEISVNGENAYYIVVKKNYNTEYHYGFRSTNYYYNVEYNIRDYLKGDREDIDSNLCYTSLDKIISSIKIK